MPFLDKEQFERITARKAPERLISKPEEKPDTSIFGGKQFFKRSDAKRWMRRDPKSYKITRLSGDERGKLVEKWWPKRTFIKEQHVKKAWKEIRKKIFEAKTNSEKFKLEREAKVLREMSGKKLF